jgi:hypothetical protein
MTEPLHIISQHEARGSYITPLLRGKHRQALLQVTQAMQNSYVILYTRSFVSTYDSCVLSNYLLYKARLARPTQY